MAQPRAVIDIVGAKSGADQLLHQIGLFIGALCRSKAGHGSRTMRIPHGGQSAGGKVKRLIPAGFAEMGQRIARIKGHRVRFRNIFASDQRHGQPFRIINIIKSITPLYAKASLIGRTFATGYGDNFLVLDGKCQLAANTAIGADRINMPVGGDGQLLRFIKKRFRHQRARRAGLHTFAATNTGRRAHIIAEIKDDMRIGTAAGKADYIIDLHFAAGTNAQITLDTGIHIHRNGGMAVVGGRGRLCRKAGLGNILALGIMP